MKPEDRKRLKQHIEMIVEHKEPDEIVRENFKKLQDEVADLREKNIKLRLEFHTLRFKESQEQRFIWWVREVYIKNIQELINHITEVCKYEEEEYALPQQVFQRISHIQEANNGIYDGTYLDVEISMGVKDNNPDYHNPDYSKTSTDNNKGVEESMLRQKLIAEACLENSKLQLKELKENIIMLIGFIKTGQNAKAHLQMLVVETLLESKPSPSDVSVTQDVLMDIKKGDK